MPPSSIDVAVLALCALCSGNLDIDPGRISETLPAAATVAGMLRVLAAVVLALLVAPATAHATWPGANGMIAMRCAGICTINPDGSGARMLPGEGSPSFSPDGDWIVHTRSEPNAFPFDIWVMRSDGSDERRLTTEHAYDYEPSWSPDGTRIVFHSTRDLDRTSIWSMAADGSDVRPILTGDSGDGWPSYSRDGSRLLVMRGTYSAPEWCFTPSAHVVSLRPERLDPRRLTEPGSGAGRPDVSPDGARVVINSGRNVASCPQDPEALFTFALDGSSQRTLCSPATRGSELIQPVWSPDGQSIVATTPPAIRGGDLRAASRRRHPRRDHPRPARGTARLGSDLPGGLAAVHRRGDALVPQRAARA